MKRVLITGGSSGIGAAVAQAASAAGWGVFVGYRTGKERAERIVDAIKTNNGHAWLLALMLDQIPSVASAMVELSVLTDSLDAVVLCASPKPTLNSFLKTDSAALTEQFAVNVIGNHALLVELWKRFFRKAHGGHVIALLSLASGSPPWPHMTSYVSGKRGLQALLESALAEFGSSGLRASLLSPDYTETPMLWGVQPLVLEAARAQRPEGRFLRPEEVALEVLNCLGYPPAPGILSEKTIQMPGGVS